MQINPFDGKDDNVMARALAINNDALSNFSVDMLPRAALREQRLKTSRSFLSHLFRPLCYSPSTANANYMYIAPMVYSFYHVSFQWLYHGFLKFGFKMLHSTNLFSFYALFHLSIFKYWRHFSKNIFQSIKIASWRRHLRVMLFHL